MYEPRVLRQIWEQRGSEPSSGSGAAHSSTSDDHRDVTVPRTAKLSPADGR